MPAEWAPHTATWMIFPPAVYSGEVTLNEARSAWSEVARTVARFEPVHMAVRAEDFNDALALLGDTVELVTMELDDAWARDVTPSFVTRNEELLAIDWRFNGWGAQRWASWSRDDAIARAVGEHLGIESWRSSLVNEGGGIEVNGAGSLLATETVQLDPERNGHLSRTEVEAHLKEALGVRKVVWFNRGLGGDYEEFGTRGHVDLLAKFVDTNRAVFHDQRNERHPDFEISAQVRATLEAADIEAVGLRAPSRLTVGGRLCDWSYVNCSFVNGGLVVGVYDDAADEGALEVLRSLLPDREVVAVDAKVLFALGGGVHCITQQQPR